MDIAIIGGGIVGMATAMTLSQRYRVSISVLEAEEELAAHQTGHNSGVIHSGLYYKPGSLKARMCVQGRKALYRFCEEQGIAHERCGKLVVATQEKELPFLEELERRGETNGIKGIKRLDASAIKEYEPHAVGLKGLFVPETGIVDFVGVTHAYAEIARAHGATVHMGARVEQCVRSSREFHLYTNKGEFSCRYIINTAGLQCDRVARMCGIVPDIRIIPFRGEYYQIRPERVHLVKNLIYPVPDPRFPFLGVHFTRMLNGIIEAGPNAVLAFKREGYTRLDANPRDIGDMLLWRGFWRMGMKYWKTALSEAYRSFSKAAFARALACLIPEIKEDDLIPGGSGVRAQALNSTGKLIDDFYIMRAENMLHVLNAPSPAATASLSIGESIATMAACQFSDI